MKPVFAKKAARPDPELLTLKAELLEAQGDLAQAYRQFDQALDPELVESCVYQISAVKARCNYLIRAIKERSPEAAAAAGLSALEELVLVLRAWTPAPDVRGLLWIEKPRR